MTTQFIESERFSGTQVPPHTAITAFYEHRAGKIAGTDLNAYATMRLDNVVY
ncbi:MAG: hypothetical protein ACI4JZ_07815 [Oscillospiraceae bacterium]